MPEPIVTRIASGAYRVEHAGRVTMVYVAGPPEDRWAFWDGQVFRDTAVPSVAATTRPHGESLLTSPMPATVVKVLVSVGSKVRRGDVVIVLEAMKMELAVRAPADVTVAAVHCREGDLVQPEMVLIDFA